MDLAEIFRVFYLECLIVPYLFSYYSSYTAERIELKFVIVTSPQLFN